MYASRKRTPLTHDVGNYFPQLNIRRFRTNTRTVVGCWCCLFFHIYPHIVLLNCQTMVLTIQSLHQCSNTELSITLSLPAYKEGNESSKNVHRNNAPTQNRPNQTDLEQSDISTAVPVETTHLVRTSQNTTTGIFNIPSNFRSKILSPKEENIDYVKINMLSQIFFLVNVHIFWCRCRKLYSVLFNVFSTSSVSTNKEYLMRYLLDF